MIAMKDLRLSLKWLFIFSFILLLVSCMGRNSKATSANTEVVRRTTDPVTVDFWHTFNDEEAGTLKEALASFQKEFPYITVKLQQVPFSDALNKYKTVAQAGNAPDIFRAEIAWTTELASMGYLMSLDAFLDQKAQADFVPQALAYSRYKGHIWGIPQVTDCLALFYNKRLTGPKPPATLEELITQGQKLTTPDGKQYAFFYRGDPYWFTPFVWAFGGDLIDNQSLQVKIAEEPAVKALNFLIDLRKKYKIVPESVDFANDYENMQIGFKNGQYAMIINGPWSTADLLDGPEFKNPDNLGIARIPQGPGGWGSPVGGHNYVVAASTQKLWASWEVIHYLSRPEIQARFALKNNLLPTRKSTYDLPAVKANRIIQSFKHVLDAANTRPVIPQSGAVFIDLKPAYQAALLGEKTPETALKEVEAAWKELLSAE
ncbi:sugar ABC transporter substrate-binding protein [bacterium (Candidatus Blackallbacteria) CG17_big_fil_post_rev_8_21_14_2_50_48_46]|uniref:Sugar ABC transporter substrate-binding protein n=1 Tax=bacterium (Candidatus Blackallbacteria) CG17_big_fil_post_rev_8_21_14_2_50_48_46 TaxID=2014261 RepID=A0A2M7G4B4_9BACT|nr:MAG: sugar ABC transporter substrate-binding protein [bacterium (Candidatus Blackallbacteria) CG18_big_fil_WC_8_21_14_2_50_49_26]PIW16703.1 MAG: sugar ABC transporter substrate-binding protein [bacterium (Candidatus Blackallbacteria) CG17_big_fil_post_rev_8_21_14_2_50_48_46]PIW46209.1 MAG: sugar ABC transporter substrate-binding protein [bacterium (Candidatus Blackallbacteria) CG13_big_fil_rev_8_21_14_2_50_49_14]